jgi:Tfp pilus assembly protein PilO
VDTAKKWVALSLAAALAILGGGWLLLVSPERQEAAGLRDEALMQQSANAQQETKVEVLRVKADALPEKKAEIADVAVRIPPQPALAELVRALTAAARSADVELVSVAPGAPAPVIATTAAAPAVPAETPPADAGPAGSLSMVPVTISVAGGYYEVEQFVAELEELRRALRLTALTLTPGAGPSDTADQASVASGRSLTTTITAQAYTSGAGPAAPAAPAGATVAADGTAGTGEAAPADPSDAAPVN